MFVTCATLAATLKTMSIAASISVTGACPANVQIFGAPSGSVIDFSAAPLTRLDVTNLSNVTLKGISSSGSQSAGINIFSSQKILIVSPHVDHPGTTGIGIYRSDTVEVSGPVVTHSLGDGVEISGSTNVNVHNGLCQAFIATALHPDCVQMWSLPGYTLQHITVQGMVSSGNMNGTDNFGDLAGSSDIKILNNSFATDYANCISFTAVARLVITGNRCVSLPPGLYGPAQVRVFNSPGAVVSDNTET